MGLNTSSIWNYATRIRRITDTVIIGPVHEFWFLSEMSLHFTTKTYQLWSLALGDRRRSHKTNLEPQGISWWLIDWLNDSSFLTTLLIFSLSTVFVDLSYLVLFWGKRKRSVVKSFHTVTGTTYPRSSKSHHRRAKEAGNLRGDPQGPVTQILHTPDAPTTSMSIIKARKRSFAIGFPKVWSWL